MFKKKENEIKKLKIELKMLKIKLDEYIEWSESLEQERDMIEKMMQEMSCESIKLKKEVEFLKKMAKVVELVGDDKKQQELVRGFREKIIQEIKREFRLEWATERDISYKASAIKYIIENLENQWDEEYKGKI